VLIYYEGRDGDGRAKRDGETKGAVDLDEVVPEGVSGVLVVPARRLLLQVVRPVILSWVHHPVHMGVDLGRTCVRQTVPDQVWVPKIVIWNIYLLIYCWRNLHIS